MNPNNLQKQLQHYFRQINRQLPCPRQERIRFLTFLKRNINIYLEEQSQCTMDDIVEHFGAAADIVDAYTPSENAALFIRKRKRLLIIMAAIFAFCFVLCGSLLIYSIFSTVDNTVTHINITSGLIE